MSDTDMSDEDLSEPPSVRREKSPTEAPSDVVEYDTLGDAEPRRGRVIVLVRSLPAPQREEYQEIHSDVVERVVDEVTETDGRDLFYQIEFRDGRHDIVRSVASYT